jgi:hypothetical protein
MKYARRDVVNALAGWVVLIAILTAHGWAQEENGTPQSPAPAPELNVIRPEGPAVAGQPYTVTCEVSWTGGPADFVVAPAEADAIEWGVLTLTGVRAFVRDGVNVISQTVEIVPKEPGEYEVPALKMAYLLPEATSPAETATTETDPSASSVSPALTADPFKLVVRRSRPMVWVFGGLGAPLILLLLLLGWWTVRRVRRGPQPTPQTSAAMDLRGVQAALLVAHQHRLDGKFYEYYTELTRAAERVAPKLAPALKRQAESAGYRGERPTDDAMDSDLRAIERALAKKKEEIES